MVGIELRVEPRCFTGSDRGDPQPCKPAISHRSHVASQRRDASIEHQHPSSQRCVRDYEKVVLTRESQASGVMMLPIRSAGILDQVSGQESALGIEGVVSLEISILPGLHVVPLPEGDRYLGFIFARAPTPHAVDAALRQAEACLDVRLR